MTREEKIKGLYNLKEYLVENPIELEGHKSLPVTLIDYAIEVIEQQPCEDAISRQDALRAFMYATNGERLPDYDCDNYPVTYDLRYIKKTLRALPPVIPQQSCEDIAKAFQLGLAFGFGEKYDEMDKVMEEVKKACAPLPKTGYWIGVDGKPSYLQDGMTTGSVWCSECGIWLTASDEYSCNGKYCPKCGTKMQEVEV